MESRGLDTRTVYRGWLRVGVRLIQLRAKTIASGPLAALAGALASEARAVGAAFILNDRPDLARLAGAGVHVGQTDLSPVDVRRIVGPEAIVGVSTHTEEELSLAMVAPVDYVAVGAVFQTAMKGPTHPIIGLPFVRHAAELGAAHGKPVVAIGGITLETAPEVLRAGAAAVAVISDLFIGDPIARAREFVAILGS